MSTSVVTGGAGFLGSHLCEALLGADHRVICVDNLETGSLANIEHLRGRGVRLPAARPDAARRDRRAGRLRLPPREPGEPDRLPAPAAADAQGRLVRHAQRARPREGEARPVPARLDERGLRRPAGAPAARDLLGARQPDRPARRLRRGEALRRGADDGLPPPAGRRHGDRAHLQHLRPADAAARRPRDPDLHPPGARGEAADRVRRRLPDAELLLRRRPRPRADPARRVGRAPARQHRQPDRDDPARARRGRRPRDRLVEPDRVRGAAGRRSPGAPARHHARPAAPRLGSPRSSSTRACGARSRRSAGTQPLRRARCDRGRGSSCRGPRRRVHGARRSKFIQKGIYDDAQILYGNPDKVFPSLPQLEHQADPRQPLVGRARTAVARGKPANPANPADPAYDWATYDRTVRYAYAYEMAPIFTVIGTPSWANASAGWNAAPTKPADLQAFVTAAARRYSGTYRLPDGTSAGRVRNWIAWNEPNNPVFLKPQYVRSGSKWVMQSAEGLRPDVQRRRQGGESGQPRRTRSPAASPRRAATTSRARSARPSRRSPSCGR